MIYKLVPSEKSAPNQNPGAFSVGSYTLIPKKIEPATLADKCHDFSNNIDIDDDFEEEKVTGNILPPELYEITDAS